MEPMKTETMEPMETEAIKAKPRLWWTEPIKKWSDLDFAPVTCRNSPIRNDYVSEHKQIKSVYCTVGILRMDELNH